MGEWVSGSVAYDHECFLYCRLLSLISIFYFSIHVIFSYSAFKLQECSIKSVSQSDQLTHWGHFFIASDRSDRSSPVCLSFFYSSEHFILRFLMTD